MAENFLLYRDVDPDAFLDCLDDYFLNEVEGIFIQKHETPLDNKPKVLNLNAIIDDGTNPEHEQKESAHKRDIAFQPCIMAIHDNITTIITDKNKYKPPPPLEPHP